MNERQERMLAILEEDLKVNKNIFEAIEKLELKDFDKYVPQEASSEALILTLRFKGFPRFR